MPRQDTSLEDDLDQLSNSLWSDTTTSNSASASDISALDTLKQRSHQSNRSSLLNHLPLDAAPSDGSARRGEKHTKHTKHHRSGPKEPLDPLEDYFVQQTKLFRHLEKRFNRFEKKVREGQTVARQNRLARKGKSDRTKNTTAAKRLKKEKDNQYTGSTAVATQPTEEDKMIGSSVSVMRSQAARTAVQTLHPAISVTRAPSSSPSASFSTSSTSSARQTGLKKKKKRVINPDAMPANEAARVLRALEIANPSSSYSLTLTTKTHKSSLPIRGTFQLPLDPRRSSETILVFAEPSSPSFNLAKQAGAAYVGGEEIFESVLSGKISPTRCLATPSMMPSVSRALARYLGPKGLMPVAKRGLVGEGEELAEKIRGAAGRMEYRADKQGLVRVPVARVDFDIPSVENNIRSFIQTVREDQTSTKTDDALTAAAKKKKTGSAIVAVRLETTNGPSIELNDVL
ncbi:hypothetical protein IAR55_004532 [Kwoniella newhampshirensis]|uniref:Ribosomal protein n=1 Tax=Kwoniella newhampshirensis TaxID=1651941 RepID=A0AAW0YL39_9TREE